MNISKYITCAAVFAAITATSQLGAAVVNITQGSTSDYTMTDGNTYVIKNSVSFSNSTAGGSGMTVADNATVVLYIPQGVILTTKGGNGSGQTGGGAGIRVPATATLIITGEGTVNATGGNAGNGGNGANGTDGNASKSKCGVGGNGGLGGGGAGAAIGGIGGTGGAINGQAGASSETAGNIYLLGHVYSVNASGGNGRAGSAGSGGSVDSWIFSDEYGRYYNYYGGGGGGGGGGAGSAPSCPIGSGGSSGGGGGKGENGHKEQAAGSGGRANGASGGGGKSKTANGAGNSSVNVGGAYGAEGGAGTLYVSSTATDNVNRTKLSAETHWAAQYTITFDANGGVLSSSTNTATATLGCALPNCIPQPTKDGCVFAGWAADQAGNEMWYGGNGSRAQSSYPTPANTTLYAIWQTSPTWFVDATTGDNLHSGLSWASAKKTIQCAVDCANDGDTIFVKPGVYKENSARDGGLYNLPAVNVTIQSTDGPSVTILDGEGMRRVVKGTAAATQETWKSHALSIVGFTIRNGYHNGPCAVAWCNLRKCIIRDNAAARGTIASCAHLENCLIISNVASNNLQRTDATLLDKVEMENCTMSSNLLMNGAGCHAIADSTIVNSIIFGNNIGGGSLFADDASVTYSCLDTPKAGEGNIVANPEFIDKPNGDYHLAFGSPCIDTSATSIMYCPVDLDGNQRIKSWSIDMGCYEFQDTPTMPEITPATGTVLTGTANVVISCVTDGATIYYTTDGSEPTVESTVYRRFRISGRTTVKAVAVKDGLCSETAVAEYATGQCANPVITPTDGSNFDWAGLEVSIAWQGEDGVLRYTTDGSDPTAASPIYGGPFIIDDSTVVKAKAFGDQFFDSAIVTANLTRVWVNVATPTITAASSFTGSKTKVAISCATENSRIYYTLDGSDPNSHSTRYTGPFYVTDSCTVKAYATCYDYLDSAVATQAITKVWAIGDTVGAPDHTFATDGDLPFVRVTDNTAPLGESMKSGAITHSQTSTLSTTVVGPGTISFQWKTSCEDSGGLYDWDHAEFWVDDTRIAQLDGETEWQTVTQAISDTGSHTLLWKYVKDDMSSEGEDCCWVADYHWASALTETQTTPAHVPYVWLRTYYPGTPDEYDFYEAAAKETAANGVNKVWECFVAGISPTNATDGFRAVISMENGAPVVGWEPDLNEGGTKHKRVYTVEGKENLTDKSWAPTNSASRFFRVKVSMP